MYSLYEEMIRLSMFVGMYKDVKRGVVEALKIYSLREEFLEKILIADVGKILEQQNTI